MDAKQALEQLKKSAAETARSAQDHLDRGTHPDAVALGLAAITDGLPDTVRLSQIGAVGEGLADEGIAGAVEALGKGRSPEALQQAIARLQALLPQATDLTDSPSS